MADPNWPPDPPRCNTCGLDVSLSRRPGTCRCNTAPVAAEPRSLMAEAVDRDGLRHVPPRSDRELLIQAIKAAGHDGPRCMRWSAVGAMLGHGSGVSIALCHAAGLDPHEMVGVEPDHEDEVDDVDEE